MNKNVVFVTIALCITVILVAFIFTKNNDKNGYDAGELIEMLDENIKVNYNSTATISVSFHDLSENQAETLSRKFANMFHAESELAEYGGSQWYDVSTDNIDLSFFFD